MTDKDWEEYLEEIRQEHSDDFLAEEKEDMFGDSLEEIEPRCSVCDKVLDEEDIEFGECHSHFEKRLDEFLK